MAGNHVFDRAQRLFDHLGGGAGVLDLEGEEHRQPEAETLAVQVGPVAGQDPVLLQSLGAAKAGRGGQAYSLGDVDVGGAPVALEVVQGLSALSANNPAPRRPRGSHFAIACRVRQRIVVTRRGR